MRRPSLFKKQQQNNQQQGEDLEGAEVIEFALDTAGTTDHAHQEEPIDAPPDGGYGWVVCGAVSLINGFTWGVAAVSTARSITDSTSLLIRANSLTVSIYPTISQARTSPLQHPWITHSQAV